MVQWTDKHYDFNYTLTEKDIEAGSIKIDPYFVAKQWKTGSKDDSGALFHVLKTVARFGDKNDVEREVKALYAQVLGVARSFGVELELPGKLVDKVSTKPHHCGRCVNGILPWPYAANESGSPCHMCIRGEKIVGK